MNKTEPLLPDAFYKSIAMSGPGLVAMIRLPDTKLLFVNDQFAYYLGYDNDALGELCFTDLLEEYHHDRLRAQFRSVSEFIVSRATYTIYKLKNREGIYMPFYLYAAPLEESIDNGSQCYHLFMQPDRSRWGMPFTSFETKELFLEQFDAEDFGTFEWLIDVDKVYWSEGIYRIYEVDQSVTEISSATLRAFTHPHDKHRVTEQMAQVMQEGIDLNIEFKVVTAKKNVKVIHALARIIKDKEGRPVKFAGSIRDVTEQRSIEADLNNKVEALNHSNKELEEFAYVASHDMQEPLRKITTFSDRLSEKYKEVLSGDGAMYLSRMIASADNMRSLINDLLDFSRVTKAGLPFESTDLNNILSQVKTDLELTIEETATTIITPELPVVDAVPTQMKQLLLNLVSNAIKFRRPEVAPVITITCDILPEDDHHFYDLLPNTTYHRIQVADNGIGFENEYATRIFQVFQRLHGKSDYPGSGIGLAICKKIVEYHHGVIYAESEPGAGTRFIFILPEKH